MMQIEIPSSTRLVRAEIPMPRTAIAVGTTKSNTIRPA